jgi:hypothetical protein
MAGIMGTAVCDNARKLFSSLRANTSAANNTSASLASSDGCIANAPIPIHRELPPAVMPTPGTSTATSMTTTAANPRYPKPFNFR